MFVGQEPPFKEVPAKDAAEIDYCCQIIPKGRIGRRDFRNDKNRRSGFMKNLRFARFQEDSP
jgi:hypothetical protein